ncbi:two-component system response regulator CreB [Desulfogranum japonicum]|uniref:two-component system response regulator CreB n=1 Tax=Desulfogranum japonicum TaxID=231447 RepID=UPI0003F9BC5B|nr:two-component system response regulator CreB [Desulfogranum japonicum]
MDKPLILIVEDEPTIADTIQYALETDGCLTERVTAAFPALERIQGNVPALVILDIGLPDMNGIELCRQIRTFSSVPIIFLTARTDEIDRVVGLEIGGDDYVVKPFSPRELAARVRAILRRTRQSDTAEFPTPFTCIPEKRLIYYYKTPLELSRYEYNLLALLIASPGKVFTRDQLMARAWDEPDASMDRTVDAHIKNLRAKLKQIRPDMDIITTHRGVGYSLKELS